MGMGFWVNWGGSKQDGMGDENLREWDAQRGKVMERENNENSMIFLSVIKEN